MHITVKCSPTLQYTFLSTLFTDAFLYFTVHCQDNLLQTAKNTLCIGHIQLLRAAHPNDLLRTEMSPSSFSHNANSVHNWRHFKLIYSKPVISLNQIQIRSYVNMYLNNISILKDSQTSSFYSKCINTQCPSCPFK